MPFLLKFSVIFFDYSLDLTQLVAPKRTGSNQRHRRKPVFGVRLRLVDVNMHWFRTIQTEEKETVTPYPSYRRHTEKFSFELAAWRAA
jgi:hypothetical protein